MASKLCKQETGRRHADFITHLLKNKHNPELSIDTQYTVVCCNHHQKKIKVTAAVQTDPIHNILSPVSYRACTYIVNNYLITY